ncbi:unnamed protein product [Vicia faba]|uniref:Uncharacterized protein n=1 Tax=Vicia faba TaxID=3906 RepID=A0AAV0YMY1_VICFA|nr:unnamed protein product [Vicia faba]
MYQLHHANQVHHLLISHTQSRSPTRHPHCTSSLLARQQKTSTTSCNLMQSPLSLLSSSHYTSSTLRSPAFHSTLLLLLLLLLPAFTHPPLLLTIFSTAIVSGERIGGLSDDQKEKDERWGKEGGNNCNNGHLS